MKSDKPHRDWLLCSLPRKSTPGIMNRNQIISYDENQLGILKYFLRRRKKANEVKFGLADGI